MSKIALTPNASGTGTFTIASPNSNTDRTLTLPDEAGTVLTNASDIESQVKTATNASGSAPIYAARAWVNFNGTGTVAIRADGNVSSLTDNGPGNYTVNFTTALADANYSFSGSGGNGTADAYTNVYVTGPAATPTTSSLQIFQRNDSNTQVDRSYTNVAVFR